MEPQSKSAKSCGEDSKKSQPPDEKTAPRTPREVNSAMKAISLNDDLPDNSNRKEDIRARRSKSECSYPKVLCDLREADKDIAVPNSTPVDSSCHHEVNNHVLNEASSIHLTDRGWTYFNNMVMALEKEQLDINTFSVILPHICVDVEGFTNGGFDQGEIELLCNDLLSKAVMLLSKKREDVIAFGAEGRRKREKLGFIIEAIENLQNRCYI